MSEGKMNTLELYIEHVFRWVSHPDISPPADEAARLLEAAQEKATRNRNNVEQLLFGARNYQAMGHKLVMRGH